MEVCILWLLYVLFCLTFLVLCSCNCVTRSWGGLVCWVHHILMIWKLMLLVLWLTCLQNCLKGICYCWILHFFSCECWEMQFSHICICISCISVIIIYCSLLLLLLFIVQSIASKIEKQSPQVRTLNETALDTNWFYQPLSYRIPETVQDKI